MVDFFFCKKAGTFLVCIKLQLLSRRAHRVVLVWHNSYEVRTCEKAKVLYSPNKFGTMLKEVDEEYRTILINFAKYKLVMFKIAKIMEMT